MDSALFAICSALAAASAASFAMKIESICVSVQLLSSRLDRSIERSKAFRPEVLPVTSSIDRVKSCVAFAVAAMSCASNIACRRSLARTLVAAASCAARSNAFRPEVLPAASNMARSKSAVALVAVAVSSSA